jgi:hypothetical protein
LFPVWMDYRGHFGTILPQAQALANAAQLRGDLTAAELSEHQLEWITGRNPFSQSAMYGEGYDFPPLYTPSSGDIVGALPVGIQTHEENDVPYWPVQSTWTYKEVWVHPVARWVWLMRNISGPAIVEGRSSAPVIFKDIITNQEIAIQPDNETMHFHCTLPEGTYKIKCNNLEQTKTFLPGQTYDLDLSSAHAINFEASTTTSNNGEIVIKVNAQGLGNHHFNIRAENLILSGVQKEITFKEGKTVIIEWHASISTPDEPWVALIIPDDDLLQRKEVSGD